MKNEKIGWVLVYIEYTIFGFLSSSLYLLFPPSLSTLFLPLFWDIISCCGPHWTEIHYVAQDDLLLQSLKNSSYLSMLLYLAFQTSPAMSWFGIFSFLFFNFYFLESATLCHSSFLKERFRNLSVQRLMWYLVQGWAEISVFLSRDIFFKFPGVLDLLCFQSPTTFLFSFPLPLNLSLNHLYLFFTREYCWYRSVEPVAST